MTAVRFCRTAHEDKNTPAAADKRIARAGSLYDLHRAERSIIHAVGARAQHAIRPQGDDHPAHARLQQMNRGGAYLPRSS